MSGSNAQKMTVEERIVQTIKDDTIMKLVGDEDALTELATRAVKEAFFAPREVWVGEGYHRRQEKMPSPVVEAAMEAARKVAKEAAEEAMADLMVNPGFRKAVVEAIREMVPVVIKEQATFIVREANEQSSRDAIRAVQEAVARGLIKFQG